MKENKFDNLIDKFIHQMKLDLISSDEWTNQYFSFREYEFYIVPNVNEDYYCIYEDENRFINNETIYPSKQVEDILKDKFKLKN